MKFPYAPKEVCSDKPSATSDLSFLNRALTHTKVSCTWDEPDIDNKRNEVLFKDDMEDKIDIDDYLAPGIDEGYNSEEDNDDGPANMDGDSEDIGIDSGADPSEDSEDIPLSKKRLVGANSKTFAVTNDKKKNVYSDFDKSKKKSGLKITFKNPLLAMNDDEDDNPLGKRVYSMKQSQKVYPEDEKDGGFFDDEDQENGGDLDDDSGLPKDKKEKFKERMKEKKKQAKIEKERKRNERKAERDVVFGKKDKNTADLELIAGNDEEQEDFRPNYKDPRFGDRFLDSDLAIDPTSTMFNKDKHSKTLKAKKERQYA